MFILNVSEFSISIYAFVCVSHPSWIQVSDFLRFSLVHFRIERIEAISCYQQYLYSHFDWTCHFLSKLIWSSNFIAASLTSSSLPSSVRPIQSKRIQNTKAFGYTHRTPLYHPIIIAIPFSISASFTESFQLLLSVCVCVPAKSFRCASANRIKTQ